MDVRIDGEYDPSPADPLGVSLTWTSGGDVKTGLIDRTGRVCPHINSIAEDGEAVHCERRAGWTEKPDCGHDEVSFFASGRFDDGSAFEAIF